MLKIEKNFARVKERSLHRDRKRNKKVKKRTERKEQNYTKEITRKTGLGFNKVMEVNNTYEREKKSKDKQTKKNMWDQTKA